MPQNDFWWIGTAVTLLTFAFLHTGILIWFLSGLNTTVKSLSRMSEDLHKDMYSKESAIQDQRLVEVIIKSLTCRVEILERLRENSE